MRRLWPQTPPASVGHRDRSRGGDPGGSIPSHCERRFTFKFLHLWCKRVHIPAAKFNIPPKGILSRSWFHDWEIVKRQNPPKETNPSRPRPSFLAPTLDRLVPAMDVWFPDHVRAQEGWRYGSATFHQYVKPHSSPCSRFT